MFARKNTIVENISPGIFFDPGFETDVARISGQALQSEYVKLSASSMSGSYQ
jgi:hypothetical protein